jgi:hypothetical protein
MTDWGEWSRQAVAKMQARNEEWLRRFSLQGAPYHWDLGTAELLFKRAGDHVVADICVIGTVSEAQGTFRWAWANEAIPSTATRGLELVQASVRCTIFPGSSCLSGWGLWQTAWKCWPSPGGYRMPTEGSWMGSRISPSCSL